MVRILGWHRGFKTVTAIEAVKAGTGMSLSEAKDQIEQVLVGQIIAIEPLSHDHRASLTRALVQAGAILDSSRPMAQLPLSADLLSELCTTLGYCASGRHPERFPTPWPGTLESLADEMLTLEGFDPQIHKSERKELRQWLLSRLGGELSDPPRAT